MKESKFIDKNLNSWKENEKLISVNNSTPRQLSRLFIKTTDDLSYANTYYKNRSVRVYLNSFAKILFNRVNKSEQFRFSSLREFFTLSVPLAFYAARKEIMISFILFAISMLIGALSSKYDPEFAQLILGEKYVSMTQENIAKNDPLAVYKSMAPFNMFFGITVNNCLVALRTFVMGIFMSIGTILIMIHNGIMVGCFQYYFIQQGLFQESFLTIWQHGVFEISSIIMAGAAGLVLGKGLIFPGNFTRFQALRLSARNGLKILLGIIPILIIAGFIEGFYTRFTQTPDILRLFTILLSLIIIIGYFVVLPWYRNKYNVNPQKQADYIEPLANTSINADVILSVSDAFMMTFSQIQNHFGKLMKWSLIIALILPITMLILTSTNIYIFSEDSYFFHPVELITVHFPGISVLILGITVLNLLMLRLDVTDKTKFGNRQIGFFVFLQILLLQVIIHTSLLIPYPALAILIYICLTIYSTVIFNIYSKEKVSIFQAVKLSTVYLQHSFSKFVSLSIRFFIMGTLFFFIFLQLIAGLNNEFIQMNLYGTLDQGMKVISYANTYYFSFMILFIYAVFYIANQILYYSLYETTHATGLQSRIKLIGKTNRIRGLIRE